MSTHSLCFRVELSEIICGHPILSGVINKYMEEKRIAKIRMNEFL